MLKVIRKFKQAVFSSLCETGILMQNGHSSRQRRGYQAIQEAIENQSACQKKGQPMSRIHQISASRHGLWSRAVCAMRILSRIVCHSGVRLPRYRHRRVMSQLERRRLTGASPLWLIPNGGSWCSARRVKYVRHIVIAALQPKAMVIFMKLTLKRCGGFVQLL